MIQCQLKLKLSPRQERQLNHWLRHLTSVWNWAIRKIEQDGRDGIYYSKFDLRALLNGLGKKIGVPQDAICGTLFTAHIAWQRCFRRQSKSPRLKGRRNRLNSIAFGHGTQPQGDRIQVPLLGNTRFHKQYIPSGHVSQMRIVKRASGWYLCLFIKAEPCVIASTGDAEVGIDPGFKELLTLSNGEKIAHPRELQASALRLAQAQRGGMKVAARINERIANQRKDRNHKLSRRLVAENALIVFSADDHSAVAKKFGKSVSSSSHYQLRQMLAYKSRTGGREYVEVSSRNSTKTCSACGARSGPSGLAGLSVRQWTCTGCGAYHDRDINAAVNTLRAGAGAALERLAKVA